MRSSSSRCLNYLIIFQLICNLAVVNLVESFDVSFKLKRACNDNFMCLSSTTPPIEDGLLSTKRRTSYKSTSTAKSMEDFIQKPSHSNNQSKLKGYNKYYYDNRKRQLETVLLVVRNQTRSRVAFTITDVRVYLSILFMKIFI